MTTEVHLCDLGSEDRCTLWDICLDGYQSWVDSIPTLHIAADAVTAEWTDIVQAACPAASVTRSISCDTDYCANDLPEFEQIDAGPYACADADVGYDAYAADLDFVIDPALSWVAVGHPSGSMSSTPVSGHLLASLGPARFVAGGAWGSNVTYGATQLQGVAVGFNAEILVNGASGTFTMDPAALDAIWWTGWSPSLSAYVTRFVSPAAAPSGAFDLAAGTWSLTFAESTPDGSVTMSLAGQLQSL